jgi:hypothetical protein
MREEEDAEGGTNDEDARSMDEKTTISVVTALAWAFWECARFGTSVEAFEKKMRGFGMDDARANATREVYAMVRAASVGRGCGVATHRGRAYDGLSWRLDVRVASRAMAMEAEAKYLLRLGRRRYSPVGDVGDGEETVVEKTLVECDYAQLKAMRDACEKALASTHGAHAGRLARYVRRPKAT